MNKAILALALCAIATGAQADDNWSGFYAGVHGGMATGTLDLESTTSVLVARGDFDHDADGYFGGLQAGVHFPLSGRWVGGVVADYSRANIGERIRRDYGPGGQPYVSGPRNRIDIETAVDHFGTVRGNLGFTFGEGKTMAFATGGLMVLSHSGSSSLDLNGTTASGKDNQSHLGWVAGLGMEHRFNDRFSVTGTWLHHEAGEERYSLDHSEAASAGAEADEVDIRFKADNFRVAINYFF